MIKSPRPLRVFLCHTSQDKPIVRELYHQLKAEGWIDVWLDEGKLLPGQDWRLEIEEAVESSDIVIICLSNNSVSKEGYVQKELRYAKEISLEKPEESIFLVPLRLNDCDVPRGLRFYQWADYFGDKKEENYLALLKSLKLRYEQKLEDEAKEHALQEKEEQKRETLEKDSQEKDRLEKEKRFVAKKPTVQEKSINKEELRNKSLRQTAKMKLERVFILGIVSLLAISSLLWGPYLLKHWQEFIPIQTATASLTPIITISTPSNLGTSTQQLFDASSLVLPGGHTTPNSPNGAHFNELEIPEEYRGIVQMSLVDLQLPIPNPEQAIRIQIPSIGLDSPIVQGDSWEQLKKGVGQHIFSANPGELGNIVLSAHNDIFGEIFRDLDQLNIGDEIILYSAESSYIYKVLNQQVVSPTLVEVMSSSPRSILTLITSYPYMIDNQRYVVQAQLTPETELPIPNNIRIGVVSGHWGSDVGMICNNGTMEVDINYGVASLVQQKLLALGYDVDLLREFDANLINYQGAALISLHSDSCENLGAQATGFKVAVANSNENGNHLVSCLEDRYAKTTGLPFHSGDITVDMASYNAFSEVNSNTPVAIIEMGYLDLDLEILTEHPDVVADGIVSGILCFINNENIFPTSTP